MSSPENPSNATGEIRPFFETLRELREGSALDELAFGLHDVVEGVRRTGKAGTLTLEITIAPFKQNSPDVVMLTDKVKTKIPELPKPGTVLFTTDDNGLQRDNPKQREMTLQPAAPSTTKVTG